MEPGSLTVVQPTLYRKLDSAPIRLTTAPLAQSIPEAPDPLALSLDVGLPARVDLLSQHDRVNYRFPLDLGLYCTVDPSIRYGVRLDIRAALSPPSAR